jgi:arabinogalactan endo-1,4-beta-galactosidase
MSLTAVVGGSFEYPKTVEAVMTDGSVRNVPVEWIICDCAYTAEAGKYEITGTADGLPVTAYLTVEERNLLQNGGFESGDLTGWTLTELGNADQLYVEDKASDSIAGKWHMHFWSAAKNSVEFTLEQTVSELEKGTYRFRISIMGGDSGECEVYAFVRRNGEMIATAPMTITAYGSWDTGEISGISCENGDELTVGIYVCCAGVGNGAWGKIDGAELTWKP